MKYFTLLISSLFLSSCSVIMAGSKDTKPMKAQEAKEQLTRQSFEKNITSHITQEEIFDDITIVTYSLSYDKAAKARMFTHATLDILTVGIWELFGSIGEANTNATIYYLDVTYDKQNNITEVDVYHNNENTDII